MAIKKTKIDDTDTIDIPEEGCAYPETGYDNGVVGGTVKDQSEGVELDLDFDSGGSDDYPSGDHHAKLEAVEPKVAQSGNRMLVWRFRTLQNPRAFWLNTVLTRDAKWKAEETAIACGAKGEGQVRINLNTLIGNVCRLRIVQGTYEGATRPEIKKVLPPTQETYDLHKLG